MKVSFFTPASKVHKQRNIMRETDARIARYTRRGILLSFSVFCICMLLGDYFFLQTTLAIILGLGILLITAIRAYLLFRFDTSYGNAPNRWRNIFFFVSIAGAAWWGLILAAV
ncbi:MAG: hybrid sensor histidine kinase/response regulator, partial [Cellvibrionaceae bacterium]|nr:hybrid sensor histidine kinase/response regulator [Cellvibrionaceae bacterium]